MARPIDAIIRLRDRFTPVLRNISREMQQHSRQHQRMGRDIARTGRSMSALGKAMVPMAGTIVAAGAGAVATFAQFDDVMLAVKAKTGANVEQFEALRKKAKELGATTRFSASEAAKGMDYLAMAGYNTNQIIAAMPGLLNLAAASGTDLAITSDIVSDVMTAFGWAAEKTEQFADIMAYTTSKSNTSVEIMGETFKYVASTAKAAGVSAQETAAAIGLMANSGVKGSMAGTALRGALTRLLTQPKACAEALNELGMSVTDSSGKFVGFRSVIEQFSRATKGMGEAEKTAYAANLFGQEAMSGMLGMIDQGVGKFDELHNGILNSAGASKEMADIMNSGIGGAIANAKSAIESLAITLGEKLAPYIMQGSQVIVEISQALNSISPETMDLAIKIAGAVIAFMAFNLIVGSVITKCGNAITTFGKISSKVKEAGSVAGYLRREYSLTATVLQKFGGGLKSAGTMTAKFVETAGRPLVIFNQMFLDAFRHPTVAAKLMRNGVINSIKSMKTGILGNISSMKGGIITGFNAMRGGVFKFANSIARIAMNPLAAFKALGSGIIGVFRAIAMGARLLFMNPIGIAVAVVIGLAYLIYTHWGQIKEFFSKTFASVGGKAGAAVAKIVGKFKELFDKASIIFSKIATRVIALWDSFSGGRAALEQIVQIIGTVLGSGIETALNVAVILFEGFFNTMAAVINGALQVLNGVIDFLTGVFTGNWTLAWQGIVEIFNGVFSGIAGVCEAVLGSVKETINSVIAGINGISFDIPEWVPKFGGNHFQLSIPMLYKGTEDWQGGAAMIHDRGAEIVDLPRGSRVYPHDRSIQLAMREGVKAGMTLPRQENRTIQTPKVINLAGYRQKQEQLAGKVAQEKAGVSVTIAKLADTVIVREEADIEKVAKRSAQYVAAEIKKAHDNVV